MQKMIEKLVSDALAEDIGQEDLTTNTIVPPEMRCVARLFAKQDGVLSGSRPFRIAFDLLDAEITNWQQPVGDGDRFQKGDLLISFEGRAQAVLTAERTALNFIQRLSGVATLTTRYVERIADLNCRICSTRKTTPLMRQLEKAAILHGGGANHRHTLFNGILIKENHIMMAGSVSEAIRRAREGTHHLMRIGVEVQTLEEFDEALAAGAEVILLDNMSNDLMREAVRRAADSPVILEASGNATLDRVHSMAETGVHFISVGALTHSAPAIDLSLLIEHVPQ